jgi:hypothetical protein
MKENEFISGMRILLENYQLPKFIQQEIIMWRERFIEEYDRLPMLKESTKVAFRYTPSSEMMKRTPEELVKIINEKD